MVFDSNPFLRVNSKVISKKDNEIKICSWLEIEISRSKWNQLEKKKIYFCSKEIVILLEKTRVRISKISRIVSTLVNFVHVKLRIDRIWTVVLLCSNFILRIIFQSIFEYSWIFESQIVLYSFFSFFARARVVLNWKKKNSVSFHRNKICIQTRKFNIQRDCTIKSERYSTSFYLI